VSYRVLIAVTNDKTGKSYRPGARVTADDFPQSVINGWLKDDPAVLEVIENGGES
jgi:hypothetical protein